MNQPVQNAEATQKAAKARTEAALRAFHDEGVLGKAYDGRLLARLWPYMRPYQALLWTSIGLGFLMATMSVARPYLMQLTIDRGVIAKDPHVLFVGGALFATVIVFEQVLNFVQVYTVQISGARSMCDLRRDVFTFLHGRRMAFFDRQPVGRLVTRVTNDVDAILELFASGALNAVVDLVKLIGIVVVMLRMDWRLSLIGFAAAPVVAVLVTLVRRRSREAFREIRAKTAQMNANMNEQVSGMAVVQAFGHEQAAADEFDAINGGYRDANIASIKYEAFQDAAIEMVAAVCLASIVVSLGYRQVSFGTVVAFNAYLLMFFEPISALAQRYTLLQNAMAGAERVFGLLDIDEADAPQNRARALEAPKDDRAFSFDHVTFEYKPGVPVLQDLTFDMQARREDGGGRPDRRRQDHARVAAAAPVRADAGQRARRRRDVVSYERAELRKRFAVVPQDVFLFPGTVATNIAAGDAEPDRARVEHALQRIDASTSSRGALTASTRASTSAARTSRPASDS